MKRRHPTICRTGALVAAVCCAGLSLFVVTVPSAQARDTNFDHQGQVVYKTYQKTPQADLAAGPGRRTLADYYKLRQYPGSPPRIPHHVEPAFSEHPQNCLSCHEKGGFSPEHQAFIPVTPHPQNELCFQCHVPMRKKDAYFKKSNWKSISPPRLGKSALPGSPPVIPHSLQMRENCIACHTGPGAVTEIRIEHASRGNCRQCHVPMISTEPIKVFHRDKKKQETP